MLQTKDRKTNLTTERGILLMAVTFDNKCSDRSMTIGRITYLRIRKLWQTETNKYRDVTLRIMSYQILVLVLFITYNYVLILIILLSD